MLAAHANRLGPALIGDGRHRTQRPSWHQRRTDFLERLAAVGAKPEDVDVVLCTHLHADHVGWNTRLVNGRWGRPSPMRAM
jgi:glyoxylase-like metal-dependent hydrolase (beta-lactamase superfamily II)